MPVFIDFSSFLNLNKIQEEILQSLLQEAHLYTI